MASSPRGCQNLRKSGESGESRGLDVFKFDNRIREWVNI